MSIPFPVLSFLLVASIAAGEIRVNEIRSDNRFIIPLDEFGFTHRGKLELNITKFYLSGTRHDQSALKNVGFFLCTADDWLRVLQQINNGEINCVLESNVIKKVLTLDHLPSPDVSTYNNSYTEIDADEFAFVFSNCFPELNVSMNVRSTMYNMEGGESSNRRDYLSAGKTVLPMFSIFFSVIYLLLAIAWIRILWKKRSTVFTIHFFMLAAVILKMLNLLCEAEDMSYIKRTGSAHGWDDLFYIFSFLKGISLFTLIVLVGTGWSFLKPHLQDREKKVLKIVIPVQVIANIAQIVIDESGPFDQDWITWKGLFLLVDVICCCAVLFPITWLIKKLQEAAKTDGKTSVNVMKVTLFRQYYIVVVSYIYFTRVVVYALETISTYKYVWTSAVAYELATLAFYVYTGSKFKPEPQNPYLIIDDDDDEEEAGADQLKLEEEFEL